MSAQLDPAEGADLIDVAVRVLTIAPIAVLWATVTTIGLLHGLGVLS